MACDYQKIFPRARLAELKTTLLEKKKWVSQDKKGFVFYREKLDRLAHLRARRCDLGGDTVLIGEREEIDSADYCNLYKVLKSLKPWRKGPFNIFGVEVDAEWQSFRKWNRIVPVMPPLAGKVVGDVGSNNGYYMFRMTDYKPMFVLGFEPYIHHYFTFKLINGMAGCQNMATELLGIEDLYLFPTCFDVLFCLGIIYHRYSPIDSLRNLYQALVPGGCLIIESQAIVGAEPMALFPDKTYAKVPGTWFVPTPSCLYNWLIRCGFSDIEMFCFHPMSSTEQRQTEWMDFESYSDFLDPEDSSLTVEGYPAPWRVYFKAYRPGR